MIITLLLLLGFGLLPLGAVMLARYFDTLAWRGSLVAYRLHLPSNLTVDDAVRWLSSIAASTHPPRLSLLPLPPVALEVVATSSGIAHYVLVNTSARAKLLASVRANMPGARLEEANEYVHTPVRCTLAGEFTITSRTRPLAYERAETVSASLLASLQPLGRNERITLQLILTSAGTPRPVLSKPQNDDSLPWWLESQAPADADAIRAQRIKQRDQMFSAVLRMGVQAQSRQRAYGLLSRTWGTVHGLNAPGARLVRRFLPSVLVAARLHKRSYSVLWWPLLLNTREAVGLTAFAFGVHLPGLSLGRARQLPPAPTMPRRGLVVGVSNYPGMGSQSLALKTADRLRHTFVLGPTGSGKSWLLARMILQDIAAGHGVIVIDPKGDLVTDVLARVDDKYAERLVVIDASKRTRPIGFNVLAQNSSEEARELTVESILHVFREIWSAFWGPRSDQIMRAALSTLVSARAPDGSALTLCELVPLLTEPAFRRFVINQPTLPDSVRNFWQLFNSWGDSGATQAINPVLNKVEAFTGRTPIRLMLGQSQGFDFEAVFRERKVVLVSLAKGTLGAEAANLLGALSVSLLWEATRARVRIPADKRRPAFAYIDEAADVMRLPVALSDMLAQARGLGLGVLAATQLIAQVPDSVKAALLGTVRTQLTFAVEHDDAITLAKRFAPLTVDDLKGLSAFEFGLRPCLDGITSSPVTGTTLPLDEPLRSADELANLSRERYGLPRADVEAALQARLNVGGAARVRFGRERSGGTA